MRSIRTGEASKSAITIFGTPERFGLQGLLLMDNQLTLKEILMLTASDGCEKQEQSPVHPIVRTSQVVRGARDAVEFACGEVGLFGVLAALYDRFEETRNTSRYETWRVIQNEIRRFDAELREALKPVENPIDEEVEAEMNAERFQSHGIIPLCDRSF